MSKSASLLLAYDHSIYRADGGEEARGPALRSSQEVNDEWTQWLQESRQRLGRAPIRIQAPPERLYWVILGGAESEEAAVARHSGRVGDEGDRFAFEAVLPVPVEETETRFAAAGSRVVGCALEREVLDDWITLTEAAGADVVSVQPAGLLPAIAEQINGAPPERVAEKLEFRSGLFEHTRTQRRRTINWALIAAAWIVGCLLTAYGWWNLAGQYEEKAAQARAASVELARNVLPEERQSADRPEQVLSNLVARRQRLQGGQAEQHRSNPVSEEFIAILENWPQLDAVELDQLSVSDRALTLSGTAGELTAADTLAGTLQEQLSSEQWEAFRPSSTQQRGDRYKFNVTGRRVQNRQGRGR
jgi:hypothetical protein